MIQELGKGQAKLIVNIGSGKERTRRTKRVSYNGKKELKRLYEEFEREVRQGNASSEMTIQELLDSHIEFVETLGRKATTIRGYKQNEKRLDTRFKSLKAKDCTTYHIEKEISRMAKLGLSSKTIKNTITFLSSAYEHAIYTKQLEDNPCKYANLPKVKSREIPILFHSDIQLFLNGISDAPLDDRVAYFLALFMGLRRSEILGLKESDVDIVNGMLYIHNTRHRVDGKDIDTDTKTARSTRTLAMPEIVQLEVAKLLQVHREFPYEKVDYLIQDGFGNAINPQALASRLHRLEVKKGLPLVSLHGLRHTYASLLNDAGVDMARISAELGHSNLTTTANIYTHIFKNPTQSSRGIATLIDEIQK